MNTRGRSLLICTNGAPQGRHAVDYGLWLAGRLEMDVTLLGVIEREEQSAAVAETLNAAQQQLREQGTPHQSLQVKGNLRETIARHAHAGEHVVVLGPSGRPLLKRWLRGHAVRRLLPMLETPLLYVPPQAPLRMERILLCTGALSHAYHAECWALRLAYRLGAALTILHVIEPVYYHYPAAEKVRIHARNLLETDVPQAQHLRELRQHAEELGLSPALRIEQGTVIHEITSVAQQGYDLLVMGSRHSVHTLRQQYQPDVTADVMEMLPIPVLAVRAGQACLL